MMADTTRRVPTISIVAVLQHPSVVGQSAEQRGREVTVACVGEQDDDAFAAVLGSFRDHSGDSESRA